MPQTGIAEWGLCRVDPGMTREVRANADKETVLPVTRADRSSHFRAQAGTMG
jgi:hypothetical protein